MIEEYVFLIMGLVLLLAGIIFVICWRHLAQYSGETTGVIIDITGDGARYNMQVQNEPKGSEEARASDELLSSSEAEASLESRPHIQMNTNIGVHNNQSNTYAPVFQYVVDDRTYSRASGLSYSKGIAQNKLGKTVPVYYDVNNPQKASLSNGKGYMMLGLGLSIGGILFCIIGFLL